MIKTINNKNIKKLSKRSSDISEKNLENLKTQNNEEIFKSSFILKGLNCPNCTAKIIDDIKNNQRVVDLDYNFSNQKLSLLHRGQESLKNAVEASVKKFERDVEVIEDIEKIDKDQIEEDEEEKISPYKIGIYIVSFLFLLKGFFMEPLSYENYIIIGLYFALGYHVLLKAIKNIGRGEIFDENFLMSLATIAAILIGEYPEALAVMLFYNIGELFEDMALEKSRKNIKAMLELKPDFANVLRGENFIKVAPEEVKPGEIIIVKPGEKVALEGIVREGQSFIDTSNLTGESLPVKVNVGDEIHSGSINTGSILQIEVTKAYAEGSIAKIIDLVENAGSKKASVEKTITKFSRVYTPIVCLISLLMLLLGPKIFNIEFKEAVYRGALFLVLSCPCAFIISVPLGIFGGIGAASRSGIFVKGGNYLEALKNIEVMVFDKTGTITKGVFEVSQIKTFENYSEEEVLELAALGEQGSNHPIAKAIKNKYGEINEVPENFKEISGKGISYTYKGKKVLVGNASLVNKKAEGSGTQVYISVDGNVIGMILVSDIVKPEAKSFIEKLKKLKIKTYMLSGDTEESAQEFGKLVGIDFVKGGLLPLDKVKEFEKIKKSNNGNVSFVGDGVNDSPVLALSDVGISMGKIGSDIAIEASDVVIMTDELDKITKGIKISKGTSKIVNQNIIFAIAVKLIVLILGALGFATMWAGVFADTGVTLIAILNSLRALKIK